VRVATRTRWIPMIMTVTVTLGFVACATDDDEVAGHGIASQPTKEAAAHDDAPHAPLGDLSKVGTVEFRTSCDPNVQPDFQRAAALLHSFFYEEARRVFTSVADRDAQCGVAHWGIAMTWYHPVWSPPTDEEFRAGVAAIVQAKQVGAQTQLERDYIEALAAFFCTPAGEADGPGCPPAHAERARRYTDAMRHLHAKYPQEQEIAAFYGLALLGSAAPGWFGLARHTWSRTLPASSWFWKVGSAGAADPRSASP
jgi:hypothetical protein